MFKPYLNYTVQTSIWQYKSSIFKTTDDNGLTNIFKEYSKLNDVFENLDKVTTRNAIKAFNNTSISIEDLSKKFGGLDVSTKEYLSTSKRGEASMSGLKDAIDNSSSSMGIATIKAKTLSIALNALTGLAVALVAKGVVWVFDELITTLDEQKEKLDDTRQSYEDSTSELNSLNDELKTTAERIDELNGKDNLTFTEKDELEKLKQTNDELERKIFLLEKANQSSEKDVADEAQNLYNDYTHDRKYNLQEQIGFYEDSSLLEGVNWDNYKDDISWLIAQYNKQQQLLKNAQDNGWTDIETKVKNNIILLEGYMADASEDYTSLYETISGLSDVSITPELESAKTDLNEILNIVAEILGYSGKQKQSSFEDVWNSPHFSKYKSEIEELGKSGELSPEVLQSNENYKKLLYDTGNSAKETCEHIKALIEAEVQSSTLNNETPILSITDTITQLNTQLRPALDALKKSYQDIFTDDGFTLENVDVDMLNNVLKVMNEMKEAGLGIDTSGFENLARILTNSSSTAEQVQGAFDNLASTILNSTDITGNLTEETASLVTTLLEEMGVANAQEIVYASLNAQTEALSLQKQFAAQTGYELVNATNDEVVAFLNHAGASEVARTYLFQLVAAEQVFNAQGLSVEDKIAKLKELATAYGQTAIAARIANMEKANQDGHISIDYNKELASLQNEINGAINNVKVDFNGIGGGSKSAGKAGKEAADAYLEAFEKELKKLDDLKSRGKHNCPLLQ